MSCCGSGGKNRTGPVAAGDRMRVNAALCATCPRGAVLRGKVVGCGHAGMSQDVTLYIQGRPCPWGKHARDDGTTRWAFLRWHGLPAPLRLWLWARSPKHPRPSGWSGCGCIVAAERAWTLTIAPAIRGRWRTATVAR